MAAFLFRIKPNNSFKDILFPVPINFESTRLDDQVVSKEEIVIPESTAMTPLI